MPDGPSELSSALETGLSELEPLELSTALGAGLSELPSGPSEPTYPKPYLLTSTPASLSLSLQVWPADRSEESSALPRPATSSWGAGRAPSAFLSRENMPLGLLALFEAGAIG